MAFNKSKALEEAARLVSQRKLPQAIKHYQMIVEQDPQDLPLRNIVGDLLVREGNVREATREFNILAEAYTREGFTLKAIAIYKKIVKLDTDSPEPLLRLAELYAGQKFSHEANEQYAQALAICERRSLHDQAGHILRTLAARDPGNAVYQMRLAEFLQRNGQAQEACAAFIQAAESASQQKNNSTASMALKRAAELEPENPQIAVSRARLAAETRDYTEVERILRATPGMASSNPGARRILLGAYLDSGRFEDAAALALEAFRANAEGIDALRQFAAHCLEAAPDGPAPPALHSFGRLLGAAADTAFERHREGEILELMQRVLARHPAEEAMIGLAVALCERAGEDRVPKGLLETVSLSEAGRRAKAGRAAHDEAAEKPGPAASGETVLTDSRSLPETLAPEHGESHPLINADEGPSETVEVDFSTEWAAFAANHTAPPPKTGPQPLPETPTESGPETVPELVQEAAAKASPELPEPPASPPSVEAIPSIAAEEISIPAPPAAPSVNSETARAEPDLGEEIAQVEFYLNSGFFSEAGAIISDLAQKYPDRSEILALKQRLETAGIETKESARAQEPDSAPRPVGLDASYTHGDFAAVDDSENKIIPLFPEEQPPGDLPGAVEETVEPQDEGVPVFQPGSLLDDLTEELAAALEETEEPSAAGDGGPPARDQEGRSLFDSSLEELLTELESGEAIPTAAETPQTHYNLGIAFREMGLLDEAIGEFQKVVKGRVPADGSPRFLEASSMLGNCFMEKQMPQIAVRWYSRALQTPGLQEEIALALTYDLAAACEQSGDLKGAHERFAEVYSMNIDYRDVAEKIQLLSHSKPA